MKSLKEQLAQLLHGKNTKSYVKLIARYPELVTAIDEFKVAAK